MIWCICKRLKSLRSQVCIAIHTSPATSFESEQCTEVSGHDFWKRTAKVKRFTTGVRSLQVVQCRLLCLVKKWVWKTWHTFHTFLVFFGMSFHAHFFFLTLDPPMPGINSHVLDPNWWNDVRPGKVKTTLLSMLRGYINGNTKIYCHERFHIIEVHMTRSQEKGKARFRVISTLAKELRKIPERPVRVHYHIMHDQRKHDTYGTAKGGERLGKELRKGSSWEPSFGPALSCIIIHAVYIDSIWMTAHSQNLCEE